MREPTFTIEAAEQGGIDFGFELAARAPSLAFRTLFEFGESRRR